MGRSSGGGGRSSGGFGGGRSSGGFRGSSRSSRSSFRPSSHSTYRHRTPIRSYHRPIIMGPSYNRGYRNSGSALSVLIIVVFVMFVVFSLFVGRNNGSQMKNTTQRVPIHTQVEKTQWYEDQIYWIKNKNVMIEGLEHFYDKTGIQPYILFVSYDEKYWRNDTLNVDVANDYLEDYYDNHFNDEGHFIFAYFECENDHISEVEGEFRYLSGYAVDTVMDNEAINILWGYFEDHYYDTSLSIEEMIADTFYRTADTIMSKPTNGWDFMIIGLCVSGGIGVVYFVYRMIKIKAKRAKEKEEYTKEILDKPLETFGKDTSELEEKYK